MLYTFLIPIIILSACAHGIYMNMFSITLKYSVYVNH